MKVRLSVPLREFECAQRNALSEKPTALSLDPGTIGAVLEVFENSESYMVEFSDEASGQCKWLGILRRSEIEFIPEIARAA